MRPRKVLRLRDGVVIEDPAGSERVFAEVSATSALAARESNSRREFQQGRRVVAWSGSMAELNRGEAGLFDADVRSWGARGWSSLEDSLAALIQHGAVVGVRPHARHIVSDIPGCVRLVNTWAGRGVSLFADPASMLTPELIASGNAIDVLTRAYEVLATEPFEREGALMGVLVANVTANADAGVRATPLREGVLSADEIERLALRCVPRDTPIVVLDEAREVVERLAGAAPR